MFELRDLARFIAIVEHGTFGRAASALRMTQPALSRRIAALERDLGATLFSRARRQIELTPVGELLVREARAVLTHAALADRAVQDAARGVTGNLRVGTRSISRYRLIPGALRRLRVSHPRAVVNLIDPPMGLHFDALRQGTIDLTLARGLLDLGNDLRARTLRSDSIVVALPHDHRLAGTAVIDPRRLAEEAFVQITAYEFGGNRDAARETAVRAGFAPRVVQTADTVETLAMYVAAGVGIAFMHDSSAELEIPGIVYRRLRLPSAHVELQAIWRADDSNPLLEPFVACLEAAAEYEQGSNPAKRSRSARGTSAARTDR